METPAPYTTASEPTQITDASHDHAYFSMMPNILDDLLGPYEYRLYAHLKRVCGENGLSFQSTNTLAKGCKMSTGRVSKAKRELERLGLIRIAEKPRPGGGLPYHEITIVDIWQRNIIHCVPSSQDERTSSYSEQASSPGETKKTPLNNTPKEDQESADADPPPVSNFEDWLKAGQATTNKAAVLKEMHDTLFPDRESPSYSYIGTVSKRVGGPGRLAQLLWEAAAKRPTGDVLAYIQATNNGRKNGNGNGHDRTGGAPAPKAYTRDEIVILTPEQEAELMQAMDEGREDEYLASLSGLQGSRVGSAAA